MRNSRYVILTAVLGSGLLQAIAEEKPKSEKNDSVYGEIAKAPEKMRGKKNPLSKDPEAPVAGGILFEEHCEECHGAAALGGKKGPSLRVAEVQEASDGTIFWVLSNGVVRKGMPVWSKLPEPQRWQLVSYIKSLGKFESEKQADPKPEGKRK